MPVPVHIVSGFLGAGKTSAIRAQLESRSAERIAVIVNDFGEAGLDEIAVGEGAGSDAGANPRAGDGSQADSASPFQITSIPGACVCCTAPEGFVAAVGAVLDAGCERLWIEPTGLARPQDLVDTLRRSPWRDQLELAPLVVLVDPRRVSGDDALPLLREQAEAADVLVANYADRASAADLAAFERWAEGLWPAPLAVLRSEFGRLPPEALVWPPGQGPRLANASRDSDRDRAASAADQRGPADAHAHARTHSDARAHAHGGGPEDAGHSTAGFAARSWRWSPEAVFSRERLLDALARLATGAAGAPLARLKGIFRTREGVYRLEVAGDDVSDRLTSYRRDSRVDVIVQSDTGEGRAALERAGESLEAALLSPDEMRVQNERLEVVLPDGRVHLLDRDALGALPEAVEDIGRVFEKRVGRAARLSALWQRLDLPRAGAVVVVAGDGFATEPADIATLYEGFLVHSLDGEPLPSRQGGPFRLLIPEEAEAPLGACANVKGVAQLVLRDP